MDNRSDDTQQARELLELRTQVDKAKLKNAISAEFLNELDGELLVFFRELREQL
jgi:hypothetical protein